MKSGSTSNLNVSQGRNCTESHMLSVLLATWRPLILKTLSPVLQEYTSQRTTARLTIHPPWRDEAGGIKDSDNIEQYVIRGFKSRKNMALHIQQTFLFLTHVQFSTLTVNGLDYTWDAGGRLEKLVSVGSRARPSSQGNWC